MLRWEQDLANLLASTPPSEIPAAYRPNSSHANLLPAGRQLLSAGMTLGAILGGAFLGGKFSGRGKERS
jgi:hypothetical protein